MNSETSKLGDLYFSFGQYSSQQGEQEASMIWMVADEDPQYCEWFIKNTDKSEFRDALEKYFNAKYPKGY